MRVLGIVVEYNPFHNGHLYHLNESLNATSCDLVVAVMSGNFVQRGEPAIIDKWARARQAILGGVDIVLELPFVYSTSSAEGFAMGAVGILDRLNCVDFLCFGSEEGNIDELFTIAKILSDEDNDFKNTLKIALNEGKSFAKAREIALNDKLSNTLNDEILSGSNNILGIEYLKALIRLNSNIKPVTIKRVNNKYNCKELTGEISSATSIRGNIASLEQVRASMPDFSFEILHSEIESGRGPVDLLSFESLIMGSIRKMSLEQLSELPDVSEGLENRIKSVCEKTGDLNDFINKIQTKRYPATRINRILINALIGVTKETVNKFADAGGPQYARVLGFSKKGAAVLGTIKKTSTIPIFTNFKNVKRSCNPLIMEMAKIESVATDLYMLGRNNPDAKVGGQDFINPIVKSSEK